MEPQGRIECEFDLIVDYDRPLIERLAGFHTVSPIILQDGRGAAYQDEGRGTVTRRACLVHFGARADTETVLRYPYPRVLVPAGPMGLVACNEGLCEMSPPYPIVELKSLSVSSSYHGSGTLFIQRHGCKRSLCVTWGQPAWAPDVRFLFFIVDSSR